MRRLWATKNPRELGLEESWALKERGVGKEGQRDRRNPRKRWKRALDVLLLRIGAWNRQEAKEVRNSRGCKVQRHIAAPPI